MAAAAAAAPSAAAAAAPAALPAAAAAAPTRTNGAAGAASGAPAAAAAAAAAASAGTAPGAAAGNVRPEQARQAARLLREAGVKLDLSDETIVTAAVFFHRFYAEHSPAEFRSDTMTMSCLFLSAKASEQQRKARDVINVFNAISGEVGDQPMPITQEFWDRKDLLVEYESYLLRALAFDVEVVLPHRYLLNYARSLRAPRAVVQVAWGLTNDFFETALCVRALPHVVACAALQLAALMLKVTLPGAAAGEPAAQPVPAAAAAAVHANDRNSVLDGGRGGRGGRGRGRGRPGRPNGAISLSAETISTLQAGAAAEEAAAAPQAKVWHEAFGVTTAALELVAEQITSNYPADLAGANGRRPPDEGSGCGGKEARAPAAGGAGNGADPGAKRRRLVPATAAPK